MSTSNSERFIRYLVSISLKASHLYLIEKSVSKPSIVAYLVPSQTLVLNALFSVYLFFSLFLTRFNIYDLANVCNIVGALHNITYVEVMIEAYFGDLQQPSTQSSEVPLINGSSVRCKILTQDCIDSRNKSSKKKSGKRKHFVDSSGRGKEESARELGIRPSDELHLGY